MTLPTFDTLACRSLWSLLIFPSTSRVLFMHWVNSRLCAGDSSAPSPSESIEYRIWNTFYHLYGILFTPPRHVHICVSHNHIYFQPDFICKHCQTRPPATFPWQMQCRIHNVSAFHLYNFCRTRVLPQWNLKLNWSLELKLARLVVICQIACD